MNFEKSFLTMTHKWNELLDLCERNGLISKNMNLESNQDSEMVSCMSGIDFTKTYDTHEVRVEPPSCMSWLGTTIIQDEHIGDLDVMEDLAEHDHIDQKDLGFMIDDDESQETHDEYFG